MKKFQDRLLILLLCLTISQSNFAQDLEADSLILVSIYEATDGANWANSPNWLNTAIIEWEGVKIIEDRVVELALQSKGLKNTMPDDIYGLTVLRSISLREPQCKWLIDEQIQSLEKLEDILIISGDISFSNLDIFCPMSQLKQFSLRDVQSEITIPECITNLQLKRFSISQSNITQTTIPAFLGNFTNLDFLFFNNTGFTGEIPESICNIENLKSANFNDNNLSGSLPDCFPMPTSTQVNMKNCGLAGEFQFENIGDALGIISLAGNQLTGDIGLINNAQATYGIDFSDNKISGEIDGDQFDKTWLLSVKLSNNDLEGIVNFSGFADRFRDLFIEGNKLNFDDLEHIDLLEDVNFKYAPQQELGDEKMHQLAVGESFELFCNSGGLNSTYQWSKDNESIDGATSKTLNIDNLTLADIGVYHCESKNDKFPELTLKSADQTLDVVSSTTSTVLSDLKVYPNPTDGIFYLEGIDDNYSVKIYNGIGQLVYLKKEGMVSNGDAINISAFSNGFYIVQLISDEGGRSFGLQKQ